MQISFIQKEPKRLSWINIQFEALVSILRYGTKFRNLINHKISFHKMHRIKSGFPLHLYDIRKLLGKPEILRRKFQSLRNITRHLFMASPLWNLDPLPFEICIPLWRNPFGTNPRPIRISTFNRLAQIEQSFLSYVRWLRGEIWANKPCYWDTG
jgi:hypothetical protein